jgi:hypothetical protein
MNVERAIEHILEMQERAETRMDRAETRMDRTDRQIAGIQKLIRTGMKLIVRIEKAQDRTEAAQKRTDAKLAELAEAQLKSERKFEKLVDLWRQHPPNGKR